MSSQNAQDDQSGTFNILGGMFENLFNKAWSFHQNGDREDSAALCRRLLAYPELSDLHKAGCHLVLAADKTNMCTCEMLSNSIWTNHDIAGTHNRLWSSMTISPLSDQEAPMAVTNRPRELSLISSVF